MVLPASIASFGALYGFEVIDHGIAGKKASNLPILYEAEWTQSEALLFSTELKLLNL